jgi:hypothetical protein
LGESCERADNGCFIHKSIIQRLWNY